MSRSHRDPVPVLLHWSGGKDSALALGRLLADSSYDVRGLLSTIHAQTQSSTVHGIPRRLLQAQADAAGLPLQVVELAGSGLEDYVEVMDRAAAAAYADGIRGFAFGDLDAAGVRELKVTQFSPHGIDVVTPLSDLTSQAALDAFLASGIQAIVVVVDAAVLHAQQVGRAVDERLIGALPAGADVAGEQGEYHSFVWNAPFFAHPIRYTMCGVEFLSRSIGTDCGVRQFSYWCAQLR